MKQVFTVAVLLLFLGLSTNAYACLVPLYGAPDMTMKAGCPSDDEQSPRELCDIFKFGVPAHPNHHQIHASQLALSASEMDPLSLIHSFMVMAGGLGHVPNKIPQNILLKTSILRI